MTVLVMRDDTVVDVLTKVDEIIPKTLEIAGEMVEQVRIHEQGCMGSYYKPLKGFKYVLKDDSEKPTVELPRWKHFGREDAATFTCPICDMLVDPYDGKIRHYEYCPGCGVRLLAPGQEG